ncbi:hypothetical protein FRC91_09655 [Bradymonadales bacterium TMQ1]|nr:hypothetical protein FRC91_09655 [Bradymonadales bacterium TMQ1]
MSRNTSTSCSEARPSDQVSDTRPPSDAPRATYQPPQLQELGQLRSLIRGFSGPGNDGGGEGTGFGDP